MALDRDEFLRRAACRTTEVEVPELGSVKIRELGHDELTRYIKMRRDDDLEVRGRAQRYAVTRAALDNSGGRLFKDEEQDTVVAALDAETIANLCDKIVNFARGTPEAQAEEGKSSAPIPEPASS